MGSKVVYHIVVQGAISVSVSVSESSQQCLFLDTAIVYGYSIITYYILVPLMGTFQLPAAAALSVYIWYT